MNVAPEQVIAGGTTVTASSAVASFFTQAQPILQFCVTLTGLVVGVLTAVYTYRKIKTLGSQGSGTRKP